MADGHGTEVPPPLLRSLSFVPRRQRGHVFHLFVGRALIDIVEFENRLYFFDYTCRQYTIWASNTQSKRKSMQKYRARG